MPAALCSIGAAGIDPPANVLRRRPQPGPRSALDRRHPRGGAAGDRLPAEWIAAAGDAGPAVPAAVEQPGPWVAITVRADADRSADDGAEPRPQPVEVRARGRAPRGSGGGAGPVQTFVA